MRNAVVLLAIAVLILSACAPQAAPTAAMPPPPSETPAPTTTPAPTETPTRTPTATPMPIPTLPPEQVGGLEGVPDPRYSNPELFDLNDPNAPIPQFVNAMRTAGIEITAEQVAEGITLQTSKDGNGKPFVVGVYYLDPISSQQNELLEGYIPLLIAVTDDRGKWVWRKSTLRMVADLQQFILAAPKDPGNLPIQEVANQLVLTGSMDASIVFRRFRREDWQYVLQNWESIKVQLDSGEIPDRFPYDWSLVLPDLAFANANNMTIRAQHLLWGGDVPDEIYNGNFSSEEVKHLLEFMVKVRVLKFDGKHGEYRVDEWHVGDELAATKTYPHDKWSFWISQLGYPDALKYVTSWVFEVNPNATLVLAEDGILHLHSDRKNWGRVFFDLLQYIKDEQLPITRIDIENNLWIGDPPQLDTMKSILSQIRRMGFEVTAEATVATTSTSPVWMYPGAVTLSNPSVEQAQLYGTLLTAYLLSGSNQFGLGAVSDNGEYFDRIGRPDANSGILDDNNQPKPAYYELLRLLYQRLVERYE
jgi:GH35 family endo-1,4-beta-xylanase